jgi:two-component system response regulator FixJ
VTGVLAIVDDDAAARKAVGRLLRSEGFEVTFYESGTDFLASLTVDVPRCIVLDLNMPDCNGFEVLEVLQRMHAHGVTVPTIVLTADESRDSMERAMGLGAVAYLTKAADDTDRLVTTVSAILGRA